MFGVKIFQSPEEGFLRSEARLLINPYVILNLKAA